MFDSQLIVVTSEPQALIPPNIGRDYRPGYSLLIHNVGTERVRVGGEDRQHLSVAAGDSLPVNNVEPEEILWLRTDSAEVEVEVLWQGLPKES